MKFVAISVLAYLLGSIPFGFIAGRITGVDVRTRGSGNIGATNVLRVLGKRYGYAVFVLDTLKGFAAVRLAFWLGQGDDLLRLHLLAITGALAVVVGHSFPIWLGFRGGKGVATSAGACLGLLPIPTLLVAAVWVVTFFAFRFVSFASMIAAISLPPLVWLCSSNSVSPADPAMLAFSIVLAVIVIWRHRTNIARLIRGTEPRFERK